MILYPDEQGNCPEDYAPLTAVALTSHQRVIQAALARRKTAQGAERKRLLQVLADCGYVSPDEKLLRAIFGDAPAPKPVPAMVSPKKGDNSALIAEYERKAAVALRSGMPMSAAQWADKATALK